MIELTETLGAERVELANMQFYGWAFLNRAALLPTREQVERAREIATAAQDASRRQDRHLLCAAGLL